MRKHSGFTLIELIAAIVVLGIIFAAGAPVLRNCVTAYNDSVAGVQVLDELRYATDRIARELRETPYLGSSSGFALNMSTTAPSITNKVDYLVSGSTVTAHTLSSVTISSSGSNVSIAYTLNGTTTTAVLTDQLSSTANSLQFAYYDQTGATTASAVNVRYVEISLTLSANGQDYSTRTRVALRNI